jgi:hypothetical protein
MRKYQRLAAHLHWVIYHGDKREKPTLEMERNEYLGIEAKEYSAP